MVRNRYEPTSRFMPKRHLSDMQLYHTRDPIASLCVRVVVRKVAGGDSDVPVGAAWTDTFAWQEKRWPFAVIVHKSPKSKAKAKASALHANAAASSASAHDGVALCSFVDADNFEPETSSRVLKLRAHREETFRQMHVVLRIGDASGGSEDLVLASMRYYAHTGLLCMTPGFSTCLVDDKDPEAVTKGPKLSTYRAVSSITGAQFEYALENENELCPAVSSDDLHVLRELQRQDDVETRAELEAWRNKHGDIAEAPTKEQKPKDDETMVLLEVASVTGIYAADPIRVFVDVEGHDDNPGTWRLRSGSPSVRTRLSRVVVREDSGSAFAAFGHHAPFVFARSTTAATTARPSLPALHVAVVSRDMWGRECVLGQAELRLPLDAGFCDTVVSLWRHVLGPHDQMEAFFLGCDVADRAPTTDSSKRILSRLGAQTESTGGTVRLRLHVIHSRPHLVMRATPSLPSMALAPPSGGVLKRSVEEIMQSVKANQHAAMARAGGALPPIPSPSANVTAILARLKDHSSPSAG